MKSSSIKTMAIAIWKAVETAEVLYSEIPDSGPAKKAWVVKALNDKFNIPLLPEVTEERIFAVIVEVVVQVWKAKV